MKPAIGKRRPVERVTLSGFLSEFRTALEDEIKEIKKSGQSSTLLYSGQQIESRGDEFWYRFRIEYAPTLPADTPCKLLVCDDQFDVTVISVEENTLTLSAKTPLPATLGKARLENSSTVLMERLIKCIEDNAETENSAGVRMLPPGGGIYPVQRLFTYTDLAPVSSNTDSQNRAVASALSNDITYIWGPPGTGKTTVIGQIIGELYRHDRSVLVVSHTNTAVDGAIEKADKVCFTSLLSSDGAYPILRLGTPARPLPDRVSLRHHVATLGQELYERKTVLETRQTELHRRAKALLPLLAKVTWLEKTRLEQISAELAAVSEYTLKITEMQREIQALNAAIQKEKSAHPEYAQFLVLSKAIKAKVAEYNATCEELHSTEAILNALPSAIQRTQDEIKKHRIYADLLAQEAEFMSPAFFKGELAKSSTRITALNDEISALTAKRSAAQDTLMRYERKSALVRAFSRKAAITQANISLQEVDSRLPCAQDELARQHSLEQEYRRQLEDLLLLQERIKAVTPSKTPEYWEGELARLQSKLTSARLDLPRLNAQQSLLYGVLCDLEQQQEQAKAPFDLISEYGRTLRQKTAHLDKVAAACTQAGKLCAAHLRQECALCAPFFQSAVDEDALLFNELSALQTAVASEIAAFDIEQLKQEKASVDRELVSLSQELTALKEEMQSLEKKAIVEAKIVGATLAKTYLSEPLRERKFDTVILDEASMASIPALWCAAYLAECSIVIVGDFLQLPPIVMTETPMAQKWLGKDIFFHSGMQERAKDEASCPGNFVMLNDQFRMESDIADVANMYYGAYGGLRSHDMNESRVHERERFYSWYPQQQTDGNIQLIDTESLHAWVTGIPQGKSHSRLNCFSAAVVVDLAFQLLERKLSALNSIAETVTDGASILIVAPYKPHVARINQLIDLEYRNRGLHNNLNLIKAGTIHSFQGSEADIVIFDLVIDEPHWKANLFMTDKSVNEDLRKMFTVAITRAKFKLYIVGNFAYCQKRAKGNALSELLEYLFTQKHLEKQDAKKLFPHITFSPQVPSVFNGNFTPKHIVCREETFSDYFMADISSFRSRLIIYSPFITETRLSVLLPAFADAIRAGKQIIVVTKALSDRGKSELNQYQKCEKELRDIGVTVLHKKGMHEKLIFIDSEAVWIGSLNALSFGSSTGEIMHRQADEALTAEYEKIFGIEHLCGAVENAYEQKCPICGGEMLLKESSEGGIYWQCIFGDYSRNVEQQYPLDGILRCKCGATYELAMKNEPRWVCTANPRHYQKMRESDLKLEKMASLLSSGATRIEVEQYFAKRRVERNAAKSPSTAKLDGTEQLTLF